MSGINLIIRVVLPVILVSLSACSSPEATYFRRYDTPLEQERIDWGLCGGDFFANGALKPFEQNGNEPGEVMTCMSDKGYKLINDYYKETMVFWLKLNSPEEIFPQFDDIIECGGRVVDGMICGDTAFFLERDLEEANLCMWNKGYIMVPPRYKAGVRIFDDLNEVKLNFCLYLTPTNNKPAVSLGMWRLE